MIIGLCGAEFPEAWLVEVGVGEVPAVDVLVPVAFVPAADTGNAMAATFAVKARRAVAGEQLSHLAE